MAAFPMLLRPGRFQIFLATFRRTPESAGVAFSLVCALFSRVKCCLGAGTRVASAPGMVHSPHKMLQFANRPIPRICIG
ncbi:hypothetical protein A6M27_12650 [Acidithiobacillus thiooxidans]|uniref:Uncharacterized protein n=1 Tax=Acidithiobacillus thiooxidans TaxID=930 RepID=A0A1C2INY2_ACITH|nr:hypothetical protein A6P07_08810 [Acidithiobacillus thiooxidans]OCX73678.1 hypothetical protein A6M23_07735 [Acidithiobacillus thiooxidans]OCX77743.1 hypothetical protein A6O24_06170 [Acidithiobacillus thiooxidans]OCX84090.1 hypothetical protein A6O26_05210 [Acidithiobacillus thiooxidans]OCX86411.1 hypothetical protein A6P08_06100 [Acidithiobacillus thiooxidans]